MNQTQIFLFFANFSFFSPVYSGLKSIFISFLHFIALEPLFLSCTFPLSWSLLKLDVPFPLPIFPQNKTPEPKSLSLTDGLDTELSLVQSNNVTWILASDWLRVIMWPGYLPLIGQGPCHWLMGEDFIIIRFMDDEARRRYIYSETGETYPGHFWY